VVELPTIALVTSLTTVAIGFLAWLRRDERDLYARERQLSHALANYETLSTHVLQLEDRVDEGFQHVSLELRQMNTVLSLRGRDHE